MPTGTEIIGLHEIPPELTDAYAAITSIELLGGFDPSPVLSRLTWHAVDAGEYLIRAGEASDSMYFVISGRFVVLSSDEVVLRELGRSSTVGEVGLLTHGQRSASVRAVRDSIVGRLSQAEFETLVATHPEFSIALMNVLANWLASGGGSQRNSAPAAVGLLVLAGVDVDAATAQFRDAIQRDVPIVRSSDFARDTGIDLARGDYRFDSRSVDYFRDHEASASLVLYVADAGSVGPWTAQVIRQADRLVVVAADDANPRDPAQAAALDEIRQVADRTPTELVLVRRGPRSANSPLWLRQAKFWRHHNARLAHPADWARIGRFITGSATGVVLSGGGARGFAHIGALRALRDAGIEVDAIGGTSMGALIGAQWACEFDFDDMVDQQRIIWNDHSPMRGFTVPTVALLSSRRAARALGDVFGNRQIQDLARSYFCVSVSLTRSCLVVHRSGSLHRYVLASMSIPGIVPPLVDGEDLLVDGGVLNNCPTNVMRESGVDSIIAVNVSATKSMSVGGAGIDVPRVRPFGLRRHRGPKLPNIMRILERAASLGSQQIAALERNRGDIQFIDPDVSRFDTFDMGAMERIIDIGYRDTMASIERRN
ncbi:cyclic nucleotide-binding and patatin-like phospholipase domain-containing protein [Smaragdicoccus niigatensis]|uniref:cyclic nucleotide-binding and patatin-like phospholipase domain-containing protein n=1 Tax=Smaragdicoccus niigatensis TaxID=359359 RepID=UPI0003608D74|nr:cyclic nucleotide-binding and patatin-like phospholipase domain-containing protein [Smaragdicoccus niigatensis]